MHCHLLRCVLGNPFRPGPIDPACLTPSVVSLARAAYEDRVLPSGALAPERMRELAQVLQDAGCDDAELLSHLRGEGTHVRGCWALDTILGKS